MTPDILILLAMGLFTLCLGLLHGVMPIFLRYRSVFTLAEKMSSFEGFVVPFFKYQTQLKDLYGILWVMNMAVTYILIFIGGLELFESHSLLHGPYGNHLLWIGLWWFVRAFSQLFLGYRLGDILILGWFLGLAIVHIKLWIDLGAN